MENRTHNQKQLLYSIRIEDFSKIDPNTSRVDVLDTIYNLEFSYLLNMIPGVICLCPPESLRRIVIITMNYNGGEYEICRLVKGETDSSIKISTPKHNSPKITELLKDVSWDVIQDKIEKIKQCAIIQK